MPSATSRCRGLVGHLMVISGCDSSRNHAHRQSKKKRARHRQSRLSLIEEEQNLFQTDLQTGPCTCPLAEPGQTQLAVPACVEMGKGGGEREPTLTTPVSVCLTEQPTSSKMVTVLRKNPS